MAESRKENTSLITGNLVEAILPSDDQKFKKIKLKINSKFTQIGDENKIIGFDIPRRRPHSEAEEIGIRNLDLNKESSSSTIFIQARAVQLRMRCSDQIEIQVNSDEASRLQIGDGCNIHLREASACRQLFGSDVVSGPVTRSKQRKRKKSTDKKTLAPSKIKSNKPVPIDSAECRELCSMFFEQVQKIIHPLRDNGNWDLFDEKWNALLVKYGDDAIWKALLMLERGIRIAYHPQFLCDGQSKERNADFSKENLLYLEEAEKTLRKGWGIITSLKDIHPSLKTFFQGRYYCYLTSVYRRKKLYGRAQESIQKAEKIFQDADSTPFLYDKATVFYEKGSRYHEFDKNGVNNEEAKESFQKCYKLCQQVREETGCDFIKKGHFAQLKKVMVLLGCSTKQGRKRTITNEDLEEAKKCINEFEINQETSLIPVSEQLQLLLAKADSYFRMKDFSQAEELAHQAIDLADRHGFDSKPAEKRLQDIPDRNEKPWPTQQNDLVGKVETVDHRVSCDADGSGSQTTGSSD